MPLHYSARILPLITGLDLKSDTVGTAEIYVDLYNRSGSDYHILKGGPLAYFVVEQRKVMEPVFLQSGNSIGK